MAQENPGSGLDFKTKNDIPPWVDSMLSHADNGVPRERLKDARTFLIDTAGRLWDAGNYEKKDTGKASSKYHTLPELYRVLTHEPVGDDDIPGLKALLHDTPSEALLRPANYKNFTAVREIAGSALQIYEAELARTAVEPVLRKEDTDDVSGRSAALRKRVVKAHSKNRGRDKRKKLA